MDMFFFAIAETRRNDCHLTAAGARNFTTADAMRNRNIKKTPYGKDAMRNRRLKKDVTFKNEK